MKQLFQNTHTGAIEVAEVPEPALKPGCLRVRNLCSAISPGTERSAVSLARSSYLRTARARPDLVRRLVANIRREGLLATYRRVRTRMSEPQVLGYASAGVVEAVGPGAGGGFHVGDRVACAGAGVASHAEVVCVPVQLAAPIPHGVSFEHAAFATLGAIALQGVRQAAPGLGERVAVIGCGLIGLLTVQLLRAHGARVAAFDLREDLVAKARELGAETGATGDADAQAAFALEWSEGIGVDRVIVTAASTSDAPMVAAAGMCRDRARVVAVGLVPFALPRDIAYAKELELRISRSYGPGRYDPDFEEHGRDYPIGYVRWTETRNLEAFLQLVAEGRVRLDPLITHRFPVEEAPRAYGLLLGQEPGSPAPLGLVIEYPRSRQAEEKEASPPPAPAVLRRPLGERVGVAFVGAGGFAQAVLIPLFHGRRDVSLERVVTAHGLTARHVQQRFGFRRAGTAFEEVLQDPDVHLVCIATRHDSHAALAAAALRAGKHVFVEKPLALDADQLRLVEDAARSAAGVLMLGFNRRFSPMAREIRAAVGEGAPVLVQYRVNAGRLPPGHWLNDPAVGGGRLVGEGCHFVDFVSFMSGDAPLRFVEARACGRRRGPAEDWVVQLAFDNGSVGQILYAGCGNPRLEKERFEVHGAGVSAWVEDYQRGALYRGRRRRKLSGAGKGHREEIAALMEALRRGGPPPIPLEAILRVSRATLQAQACLTGTATGDGAA